MSRDYPDWLNPFKAAQARREFAGTVALARLAAAVDLIEAPADEELGFELTFALDDQRQACVRVRVFGEVPLMCQRTLVRYLHRVDSESLVGIVASEAAVEALPEDYEPLVVTEPRVRVVDLLAEELLLALPLVPRAPDSEPVVADRTAVEAARGENVPAGGADTQRPFAALAELTGKTKKH